MSRIIHWTPSMDDVLRGHWSNENGTYATAAEELAMSIGAIRNRSKALGLKWVQRSFKGANNPMFGADRPDFKANHWTKVKPDNQDGERNHRWKGGEYTHKGYIISRVDTKTYASQHRLVMEQMLGRKLRPEEVVHHKDRNRSNNSPDNLQLLPNQAAHIKLHLKQGDLAHHA